MQTSYIPKLSVIIPTIGRGSVLLNTLNDLVAQDFEKWECLIVTQGPLDPGPLVEAARGSGCELRVLSCSEPNASLARNIGLIAATGDVVLFLDDDLQIPSKGFLAAHCGNYADKTLSGVFGQVLDPDRRVRNTRHRLSENPRTGWLYFPRNYTKRCRVACGGAGNLSVRREWAIEVGGMDAQFEKGAHREESDFCLRLTEKHGPLVFDPAASVIHLGAAEGGCRSWGKNTGVHPPHHVTGEWYFILKNVREKRIRFVDLPHHFLHLYLRQIWNLENRWRFARLLRAVTRSFQGYRAAISKLREGAKYMDRQSGSPYTLTFSSE